MTQTTQKAVDKANLQYAIDENNKRLKKYMETAAGGSADCVILQVQQTAHALEVGNVVYLSHDGNYKKAIAKDSAEIEAVGIVSKVTDADNFVITTFGNMTTDAEIFASYSPGVVLYLSEDTEGGVIDVTKTYTKPVAIKTNGGIHVMMQRADMKCASDGTPSFGHYTEAEILDAIKEIWGETDGDAL